MFLLVLYLVISTLAEACKGGEASANCGNDKCELVGSKQICTTCTAGFVPINGICKAHNSGDTTAAAGAGCETGGDNSQPVAAQATVCGKCTSANYFLFENGCYDATKGVGKAVCTAANGGICTAPASGYFIIPSPDAVATAQSVFSCSDIAGVTLTGNKKYTGTANCATCNKPTAASAGTPSVAECATCNAGFDLDTDKNCISNDNTNKGDLSSGAIAGISVAAVVVVGGLVGFLCWWFICRGKA